VSGTNETERFRDQALHHADQQAHAQLKAFEKPYSLKKIKSDRIPQTAVRLE